VGRQALVMADEHQGAAALTTFAHQQGHEGFPQRLIQGGGRFIRDHQCRAPDQRAGRRHTLLLADGQGAGAALPEVGGQLHALQQPSRFLLRRARTSLGAHV